ncbi:MAG: hypothetical protein JWO05_377 [Gemmatimonadetes bacterium]|nr:hypothetical protein [Gemmatimonadota bacterium]
MLSRRFALAPFAAAMLLLTSPAAMSSQQATQLATLQATVPRAKVPYGVGERAEYEVKFGPVTMGSGTMEVAALDQVRGHEAYRTIFRVKGGPFFFKVDDRLESWIDTHTLSSLRHRQDLNEGSRDRERNFEIFPERATFSEDGKPEEPSVANPLDDGSFMFFVRTLPLEVGKTYEFPRYFKPDRNPVKIQVLRRERVKVPAGTFDAIVVRPIIKAKGIFSENGQAEVWLSDDAQRVMLQMKSKFAKISISLFLKSYRPATPLTP